MGFISTFPHALKMSLSTPIFPGVARGALEHVISCIMIADGAFHFLAEGVLSKMLITCSSEIYISIKSSVLNGLPKKSFPLSSISDFLTL